jgi:iron complex transport system ATP-binding protein
MMQTIELSGLKIGYSINMRQIKQIGPTINFNASEGELIALIGPNGIGKSTLLRTIVRLILPLSGKLTINTKPLMKLIETNTQLY